ncbi:hypothetical protein CTAYLR_007696 [Chrysophaeum taylorii]|uniref:peptidylprolyl isomerase n=1 Tax=Chrysophaeum taylorii TaxID=2483200 RepID=A0AAD7U695_9STRA|nr:hypothetical protein CTAYLR_007696 [Chrysophaeum taylorii]
MRRWLPAMMMVASAYRCSSTVVATRRMLLERALVTTLIPVGGAQAVVEERSVTDEIETVFSGDVGLELSVTEFARVTLGGLASKRIAIRRVLPGSAAEKAGLRAGWILVSANGVSLEGRTIEDVARTIGAAARPLRLVTRDPEAFNRQLLPGGRMEAVTSVLADYDGERQILAVDRLKVPEICTQGAVLGDLLEVRFEGRLEDGRLFDGSAITFQGGTSVPGRAGDSSLYFVLGQQPLGQFPTAWDPALAGACVGEVRRVRVPPVIGFQDKGSPRRGVPPFATLYYTLELLSINGVALPR